MVLLGRLEESVSLRNRGFWHRNEMESEGQVESN